MGGMYSEVGAHQSLSQKKKKSRWPLNLKA